MLKHAVVLVITFGFLSVGFCKEPKSVLSKELMSADAVAVYETFLRSYVPEVSDKIHVSNRTVPFGSSGVESECLTQYGIKDSSSNEVHNLDDHFARLPNVVLVDPKHYEIEDPGIAIRAGKPIPEAVRAGFVAGLLTVSEIVFSKDSRFAAFAYSFRCGSLCGNGATAVFERTDKGWKRVSDARCGAWISKANGSETSRAAEVGCPT